MTQIKITITSAVLEAPVVLVLPDARVSVEALGYAEPPTPTPPPNPPLLPPVTE